MSRQTKDTKNLERVRDNQRRSRARRREHLLELEQRIRSYELQGVEASAEVQQAARRVAEENRQLRTLLNRHGFSDEYIMSFLQTGVVTQHEPGPISHFTTGTPGEAVQTLQQAMAPRRPVALDHGVPYPIPPHPGREPSIANVPTTSTNSLWQPTQPVHSGHSFPRPLLSHAPLPPSAALTSNPLAPSAPPPLTRSTMPPQVHSHQYPTSMFPGPPVSRTEAYHTPSTPGSILEDPRRHSYSVTPLQEDTQSTIHYAIPMHSFQNTGGQDPVGPDPNSDSGPPAPC